MGRTEDPERGIYDSEEGGMREVQGLPYVG